MARYTGPSCRLCRRLEEKLMLKGERCNTPMCALERRGVPPGGRSSRRRRRISERGMQLREKQKARNTYGLLERQFHNLFTKAERIPGVTGDIFVQLLESRLDNVVYRLGFASSRAQARQIVRHGFITVNGRKTDIPSCLLKPGDIIAWSDKGVKTEFYKQVAEVIADAFIPNWISLDKEKLVGRFVTVPPIDELDVKFDTNVIVEYYSR